MASDQEEKEFKEFWQTCDSQEKDHLILSASDIVEDALYKIEEKMPFSLLFNGVLTYLVYSSLEKGIDIQGFKDLLQMAIEKFYLISELGSCED